MQSHSFFSWAELAKATCTARLVKKGKVFFDERGDLNGACVRIAEQAISNGAQFPVTGVACVDVVGGG